MRVLSSLATRDSSLIKPAGKLKLWGVGLFEDGPLGLDQLLANEKVTYAPMRDCIMQFLVTILAYGEQLCKDLSAGDDNIQTLKEEIVIIFELEELLDMVVEGRQDAAEGTHDTSEIASSVKRLFALSPSIRRARQLQSLQLHEIAGACVNENQTFTGYTTNFTSTESPVEILYHRLEAVAEIIRKYDKAAATKATDAKIYLPAFDKQRKQLGEFYEVWCTRSSLHSIEKSVMKARKEEARLTNALGTCICILNNVFNASLMLCFADTLHSRLH